MKRGRRPVKPDPASPPPVKVTIPSASARAARLAADRALLTTLAEAYARGEITSRESKRLYSEATWR